MNQLLPWRMQEFLRRDLKLALPLHVNVQTRQARVQYAQFKEI